MISPVAWSANMITVADIAVAAVRMLGPGAAAERFVLVGGRVVRSTVAFGHVGAGTCICSQISQCGCEGRRNGVRSRGACVHSPSCISRQFGHKPLIHSTAKFWSVSPTASAKLAAPCPPLPPLTCSESWRYVGKFVVMMG